MFIDHEFAPTHKWLATYILPTEEGTSWEETIQSHRLTALRQIDPIFATKYTETPEQFSSQRSRGTSMRSLSFSIATQKGPRMARVQSQQKRRRRRSNVARTAFLEAERKRSVVLSLLRPRFPAPITDVDFTKMPSTKERNTPAASVN